MRVRVFDFDSSVTAQSRLLRRFRPEVLDLRQWGPRVRLGCRWSKFYRLERRIDRLIECDGSPVISLLGSDHYHHLSLALLRRLRHPFNLLVLDSRLDWYRGSPILHSRTWVKDAAQLPNVRRVFHVGARMSDSFITRWLSPSELVKSGKIVVLPASMPAGCDLASKPLRADARTALDYHALEEVLWPYLGDLDRFPLYVSLDKSVLWMPESVTNSAAGELQLDELKEVLQFFLKGSGEDLLGMDIVGDWSPAASEGILNFWLGRLGTAPGQVEPDQARLCNEHTNLALLRFLAPAPANAAPFCRHRAA